MLNPLCSFRFYNNINCRIKSTFNLPDKKIYTGAVIGNGISLGLDNGTQNFGLTGTSISGDASAVGKRQSIYGTATGTSLGATTDVTNGKTFGLTTDPTKSGMIVEPDADVVVCIKF